MDEIITRDGIVIKKQKYLFRMYGCVYESQSLGLIQDVLTGKIIEVFKEFKDPLTGEVYRRDIQVRYQ